ncbi:MAG: hypothetical protein V4662_24805 [Verrucomicrobiota bacterium]
MFHSSSRRITLRGRHSLLCRPLSALLLFMVTTLHAHHGRDFILVQDSAIPDFLSGVAIGGIEWTSDGDTNEFSTEPGFYVGLSKYLAFGLSAGFSDDGDGWKYTGVTPQVVLSLIPPTGPTNFRAGLWMGYEYAEDFSSTSGAVTHAHGGGNNGGGPDAPPLTSWNFRRGKYHGIPAASSASGSSSDPGGITRAGESGLQSRLILESDMMENTRAVLNLVSFVSGDGGKPGFGYAAGIRHELNHDLSFGIEALGDFEKRQSSHQVLLTTMIGLPRHLSLRLGIGAGITRAAPDFTLHTSFLWRF